LRSMNGWSLVNKYNTWSSARIALRAIWAVVINVICVDTLSTHVICTPFIWAVPHIFVAIAYFALALFAIAILWRRIVMLHLHLLRAPLPILSSWLRAPPSPCAAACLFLLLRMGDIARDTLSKTKGLVGFSFNGERRHAPAQLCLKLHAVVVPEGGHICHKC